MAAILYYIDAANDTSVFKESFPVVTDVRIPFLDSVTGSSFPDLLTIVSKVGMQNSETIQYFLTFDDVISYFYFGKGMGSLEIAGMMFGNSNDMYPGLRTLFDKVIGKNRGKKLPVSFGSFVFYGVIDRHTLSVDAETGIADFSLGLSIIDHTLPSRPPDGV